MGFAEMMTEALGKDVDSPNTRFDVKEILAAMEYKTPSDLKPGDVLRQKKLGKINRYKADEVVFVRYVGPSDAMPINGGNPLNLSDIIVCGGVDPRDGQLLHYAAESRHYEKI
ncbi:MAG: hypothetical protein C0436_00265 [Alphaproteobacteria bacterium]|nr:hypothetical protein [Alphaproteobacteria bacterium]